MNGSLGLQSTDEQHVITAKNKTAVGSRARTYPQFGRIAVFAVDQSDHAVSDEDTPAQLTREVTRPGDGTIVLACRRVEFDPDPFARGERCRSDEPDRADT